MTRSLLDIIKEYVSYAPVDVYGLARALGLMVEEKMLIDDCSGSIERAGNSYKVTVNSVHSANRKRFTVAHELGHFVLHDHLIDSGIYDNKMYRDARISDSQETEANKFAASILMPSNLIYRLKKQGFHEAPELARELEVSEQAINIRLENIK
jgi:Zn-dependent peptidase ImmA (M78 family)